MSNITERESIAKTFGIRLCSRRKKIGLSQEKLAEATGITRESISKYENGKVLPDLYNLKKISTTLDCSYEYLMGESEYFKPQHKDIEEALGLSVTSITALEQLTMVKDTVFAGRPDLIATINLLLEHTGYNFHIKTDKGMIQGTGERIKPGLTNMINDYLLYDSDAATFSIQKMMKGKMLTVDMEVNADTVSNLLLMGINNYLVKLREYYEANRNTMRNEYNKNRKLVEEMHLKGDNT